VAFLPAPEHFLGRFAGASPPSLAAGFIRWRGLTPGAFSVVLFLARMSSPLLPTLRSLTFCSARFDRGRALFFYFGIP